MSNNAKNKNNAQDNSTLIDKGFLKSLNFNQWPFDVSDLPKGAALVGGAVRDALLGIEICNRDLDFVIPNNAKDVCKRLQNKYGGTIVLLDQERDISRLVIDGWTIDFARQVGLTFNEDLLRRDFTINAIAILFDNDELIVVDPTNGIYDLKERKLAAISEQNLIDDPLRCLRAFRLMSELNFCLDKQTEIFIFNNAKLLQTVASERIKGEIERFIQGTWADHKMRGLRKSSLLLPWRDSFNHKSFEGLSLKNISDFNSEERALSIPMLRLTHLISDKGLMELKFSKKTQKICSCLRYWLKKNDGLGFRSLHENERLQLHQELEEVLPALIITLNQTDQKIWLQRWRNLSDPLFHPFSPIDGDTLQRVFKISEGPIIGKLLYYLRQENAFARLPNHQEALKLARNWLQHN